MCRKSEYARFGDELSDHKHMSEELGEPGCAYPLWSRGGAPQCLTQKPTWPYYWRQRTAFEADTGRSALAAGTALYAPELTFDAAK